MMAQRLTGRPNGRTEKPIDWKKVDDLLIAGCNGTEIAPHFNMHVETFYDRVLKQYGVCFTEYQFKKCSQGNSLLRVVQFNKALKGDNTMLVWLGKNRLKQAETPTEIIVDAGTMENFKGMMTQLTGLQEERKIPNSNISEEQKSE